MADAEDLKYVFQFLEQVNNQQNCFVSAVSGASACVGKVGANHNQQMCMLAGRIRWAQFRAQLKSPLCTGFS
jgi:hypothetical protein